ncbi:TetR-like C-terminal domain-containing protein [Actinophytocola sp.]|uniref:TetR-like C-terminal domain-containing protein n=1 Tax=Actinophytocola sp. TaxID=1872138 RepID=UPI003D6C68BD
MLSRSAPVPARPRFTGDGRVRPNWWGRPCGGTPVTAIPETPSLREDLLAGLRALRASLTGQDAARILGLLVAMRHDRDLALTVRRHVLDHKREVFATVLARAVARGDAPAGADHALLAEISSATLFSRLLITAEPLDDEFLCELVDAVLLAMLNHESGQR